MDMSDRLQASPGVDCHHIVTASEAGEMSCWDTQDGSCLESKKLGQVHTNIQAYRVPDSNMVKLFCCGFYEEVSSAGCRSVGSREWTHFKLFKFNSALKFVRKFGL